MVRSTDIEFFHENGFLLMEGLLDKQRCESLIDEAEAAVGGHYTNYLDMHKRPGFHAVHVDPAILEVTDALYGARMVPIGSIFFFCKPGNPLENGSVWHQDNYAARTPDGSYLVVGVPLDDADEENGSLVVVPGSHKCGPLPHAPKQNFKFDSDNRIVEAYPIGDLCEVPAGLEPVQLRYKRGDVLFMHGHTVHRAEKNTHPTRWRRKIYLHYVKDGTPFWPGWHAQRQLIERPMGRFAREPAVAAY